MPERDTPEPATMGLLGLTNDDRDPVGNSKLFTYL